MDLHQQQEHTPALLSAAFTAARQAKSLPLGSWVTWAHIGTTISIVIFLWSEYQGFLAQRAIQSATIAKLDSEVQLARAEVRSLHDIEESRHTGVSDRLHEVDVRLQAQREDIRAVQAAVLQHSETSRGGSGIRDR